MLQEGTALLEEAVFAYRQALTEFIHERTPDNWAQTQLNLAFTLTVSAERGSGTARLEEAAVACHEVLKVWKCEDHPTEWEAAQSGLGQALYDLGLRGGGAEKFAAAAVAYRKALTALTPERDGVDWAATQYNLGLTLENVCKAGFRRSATIRPHAAKGDNRCVSCRSAGDPRNPLPSWHAFAKRKLAAAEDLLRLHGTVD